MLSTTPTAACSTTATTRSNARSSRDRRPEWVPESFPDAYEDVRTSVARLKATPFIPHRDSVRGFVYHVESGELREVT